MVISIIFVLLGTIAMFNLPVAQFPDIVPPEVQILTTYNGADAQTVEQSVATPMEQQISGVDNMNYMYSVNASNGTMRIFVNFDVKTDPNTDLIFTQMRQNLAEPQLPTDVRNYGVNVVKSRSSPLMIVALASPKKTYDSTFIANYANINLIDQLLRTPGRGPGERLRRGAVRDTGMGQPRCHGQARPHGPGYRQRAAEAEHGQSRRPARRGARAPGPGVHLHGARSGKACLPGGIRLHRAPGECRRLDSPSEGRGPHRAWGPGLQRERAHGRRACRAHGASTRRRARMRSPRWTR